MDDITYQPGKRKRSAGENTDNTIKPPPRLIEKRSKKIRLDTNNKEITHQAVLRGTEWIIKTTKMGLLFKPTPIGLYFSKLWYFESLYPIIFTVGALNRLDVMLSTEKGISD